MAQRKTGNSKSSTAITKPGSLDPYTAASNHLDELMVRVREESASARNQLRDEGFYLRLKMALANDKRKAIAASAAGSE